MSAKKISMDQIRGVMNMGRGAEENMGEHLHLSVLVDEAADRWLVETIRDALVPERDALVDAALLGGIYRVADIDVGIIIAGGSDEMVRAAIRAFAGARQHVVVVAQSSLDMPDTHLPSKLGQYVSEAISTDRSSLLDKFANALLDATEKDVSCAANFKFCRDIATARLVSRCAARNAFMSVADFIPGAGMPLMTMNQINLSFDIAATYGKGMSIGRIPEVTAVVFVGFAYRWAARKVLRFMPAFSLLVRAGMAYGGTLVTGRMLSSHFTETLVDIDRPESKIRQRLENPLPAAFTKEEQRDEKPAERVYITLQTSGA